MGVPVDVTFREMWPSDEVMVLVQEQARTLSDVYDDVGRCRVVIERPRSKKGRRYRVSVTVSKVTSKETKKATAESEHSKIKNAVSSAFRNVGPRLRQQLLAA